MKIDTTPSSPQPPESRIYAAMAAIPELLSNVEPDIKGEITVRAIDLVRALRKKEHSLTAAKWAIHRFVVEGKVKVDRVSVDLPAAFDGSGNLVAGGGKGCIPLPQNKPAPFDAFRVIATDELWEFWRSQNRS
ncbi:MAG: hypothetical protein AAGA30_01435 [Planctomycetota bacterium]